MIRYLKVEFEGPTARKGIGEFCTLTSVKVYGRSMHSVMRNSLLDLVDIEERA